MAEVVDIKLPYLFEARDYQQGIMTQVPRYYSRGVFVHHRRAGKDKSAWNKLIKEALKTKAIYYYFFPTYKQGRKAIWDAIDPRTGLKFLDHIPKALLKKKNDTEMKIILANDSLIQIVGTDDYNAVMGTNPYGCVFSEYALQDPRAWEYIRPILRENKGWAIFVYTPRGMLNHGFRLYQTAMSSDDWYAEVKTVNDTKRDDGSPVVSEEDIQKERDEDMPDEMIEQEYFCNFEGFVQGAYYAKQMREARNDKRVSSVPYDSKFEVYTAWDLGVDDSTTIWFFQLIDKEIRFIDYLEDSGEGLGFYAKELDKKPYKYGDHYLPHDGEARKLAERAETPRQILERLSIKPIRIIKRPRDTQAVKRGIQAGRNILSQCYFDKAKCSKGIAALENYHAEYDEVKKKLGDAPHHDHTSHGADSFRTFAVGFRPITKKRRSVSEMMDRRLRA
jgi:hypothetical protein